MFSVVLSLNLLIAQGPQCLPKAGKNCVLEKGSSKMEKKSLNIKGEDLKVCGMDPITGFTRNGYCETGPTDYGVHTVCAVVTDEFLEYTRNEGNDLSTPNPQYGFKGLKAGDSWCLCAGRWLEAYKAGKAPLVDVDATEIKSLEIIDKKLLLEKAKK